MKTKLECISVVFSFKLFWENVHWDTSSACSTRSALWHQHLERWWAGSPLCLQWAQLVLLTCAPRSHDCEEKCYILLLFTTGCCTGPSLSFLSASWLLPADGRSSSATIWVLYMQLCARPHLFHCQWRFLPGSASHKLIAQLLKLAQLPGEGSWLLYQVLEEFDWAQLFREWQQDRVLRNPLTS